MLDNDQLQRSIDQALDNLSHLNEQLFYYWLDKIYDVDEETIIESMLTLDTLAMIEKDVMMQELA